MFAIVNGGEILGLCDKPRYVAKNQNGVLVEVSVENAECVALGGTAYSLDVFSVKELDCSELVFSQGIKLEETSKNTDDAQDAICILSEDIETRLADIEDALCEMSATEEEE